MAYQTLWISTIEIELHGQPNAVASRSKEDMTCSSISGVSYDITLIVVAPSPQREGKIAYFGFCLFVNLALH